MAFERPSRRQILRGITAGSMVPVGTTVADGEELYRGLSGNHGNSGGAHLVAFISEEGSSEVMYDFTADGPVEFTKAPYESPSGKPIEGGTWSGTDYVEQSDGIWKAGGGTGGGYGDAYLVDGPVLSVDLHSPDEMWIELDGERVTVEELVEQTASTEPTTPEHLVAFISEKGSSEVMYDFTAGGPIEFTKAPYESPFGKPIEGGTWSSVDYVEQVGEMWEAGGGTGNGYGDAYLVRGPVLSADLHSPDEMWIELDGERVTVEELIDRTASADDVAKRVNPDRYITVSPGTELIFELEAPGYPKWSIDGDSLGGSLGPWHEMYRFATGAYYWQHTFDSEGKYVMHASDSDLEEEAYTMKWVVSVKSNGVTTPIVDDVRPDTDEPLPIDYDGSLEVDVSHVDGELDRVVWWLHQADIILGITDVDGATATASLPPEDISECHTCTVVVWVISESGAVIEEKPWNFESFDS